MEARNISVNIGFSTIAKTIFFVILLWVLYQLRDLFLVVLTAVVIASAIEPMTRWFIRYRIPRVIAVLIMYLIVFSILFGIVFFFIPPLIGELQTFSARLPEYINSINISNSVGTVSQEISGSLPGEIVDNIGSSLSVSDALTGLNNTINKFSGNFFNVMAAIFGGALSFVLIIVISFYLAVQERGIENFLAIITPVKHEKYIIDLWHRSQNKIGLWLRGQLLLALLVGILVYLALTIFGIKFALLLAVIAAVFELIPIFGPVLAGVPAVIIASLDGGLSAAFIVLIIYIIIQQFENQLLYPLVVRHVVGVPSIVAIIAIIAGGQLAGLLGVILSVPLAAILMELFNDLDREKHHLKRAEKG